jgi:drug/metabolite transporter (DMT)-like permease
MAKKTALVIGIFLMVLAAVIQFDVLRDFYIVPKEELPALLISGLVATFGFLLINYATCEAPNDQS